MKTYCASCDLEVQESENWLCPYYSRPEEMKRIRPGYSHCGVNCCADGTCLEAIMELEEEVTEMEEE